MNKNIKSITIMGGGTAGFISALVIKKKFPHIKIQLIKSEKIGIIGVGEGTTEHWKTFSDLIGVDMSEYLKECDATIKIGVLFENWSNKPYVHNIMGGYDLSHDGYYSIYAHLISNKYDTTKLSPKFFRDNLVLEQCLKDSKTKFFSNQLHFDSSKLNSLLEKKSKEFKIEIITDDIVDAVIDKNGNISSLISNKNSYESDFFIDCSGFQRFLLHKKLNMGWKSYEKHLILNSAFSFFTEEMENYNIFTKASAQKNGWSWTIPTQKRTGNGYVFCDKFTTFDDAKKEMDDLYKKDLKVRKSFKFEAGRLEKFWHKNCVAIGISGGFVEPLEASTLGYTIQQIRCLCNLLPSGDEETYNYHMNNTFDNVVDFVQAHYLVEREDTPFWKEIKNNLILTDSLSENLKKWKNRLPHASDINCSWPVFHPINYIQILYALNWFNIESIKDEYNFYGERSEVLNKVNQLFSYDDLNKITHREFISRIINTKKHFIEYL